MIHDNFYSDSWRGTGRKCLMTGIALFLGLMMVSLTATASGKGGNAIVAADDEDEVFMTADKMPVFPGGEAALMEFIREGISYPPEAADRNAEGRVIVQFVVDKTGQVGDVKVVRSVDADLDREAVRVVQTLPAFTPAFRLGKPVSVWYTLPVNFKLENDISYLLSYIHDVDSISIDYCDLKIETPAAIMPSDYDAGQLRQSRNSFTIKRKVSIRRMVKAMGGLAKLTQGHLDTRGKITLYFKDGKKNSFYYDRSSLYYRGNYYDISTFTAAGAEFRKILYPLIQKTE